MSDLDLVDILRSIHFLEDISVEELRHIASVARLEAYTARSTLFRVGDRLSCIFLMVDGSVALELPVPAHGAKRVYTVGPGELFGWSPLLDQLPATATARALTPTRVVCVDAGQILALCHHDPQFGFAFMRRTAVALAKRLEATRLQLLDIYRHELPTAAGDHGEEEP
jgi:CRP/FNR family cyclic AMP-dependent transcriptional regulator